MTEQQIQISKDSELMAQVISLIASYAIENDISPNETIKTVAENMLVLLEIATFENWEKKTLPSVISTSDDCVSREQAKMDVIPNSLYTSEQVIALLDNLPPVTPTQSWIPVSERLPTKEEYIANNGLFIVSDGNRTYAEYFDVYNSMKYFGEPTMNGFRVDRCVIAWQPLPKTYEERGNENEVN